MDIFLISHVDAMILQSQKYQSDKMTRVDPSSMLAIEPRMV